MAAKPSTLVDTIVRAALAGELTAELADQLHGLGPEAVSFAMMAAATRIAELEGRSAGFDPATPSGMVPVYQKPNQSKSRSRSKKPGGAAGDPGARRRTPTKIDRREPSSLPSARSALDSRA